MNKYKWSELNDLNDLVFVIDIETKEVLIKNNIFEEIVQSVEETMQVDISTFYPTKDGCHICVEDIVSYINEHEGEYTDSFEETILDNAVTIHMRSGYYNQECTELYFIFTGYNCVLEFLRYRKAIYTIPQMIIIVEFNDALTFCYGNQVFSQFFDDAISFEEKYNHSFLQAMPQESRETNLLKIRREINAEEKSSSVIELYNVAGNKHYVKLNATLVPNLLFTPCLCIAITLVDDDMRSSLKLQSDNEVYNIAQQLSSSIAYRITIEDMAIEFIGDSIASLYLNPIVRDISAEIIDRNFIHEDDVVVIEKFLSNLQNGVEEHLSVRVRSHGNRMEWHLLEYTIIRDEKGVPTYAIGKLTNVQSFYDLQDKANLDLLTGCLNKGYFEEVMSKLLHERKEEQHVFIIIDLDNFKAINDNLGHYFGDIVLKEVSDKLRRIFRSADYIGRIGGDEFVVLMRSVHEQTIIERKVKEIIESLDITYKKSSLSYRITASVGVALIPDHGKEYTEIYQNADTALYRSKNLGKNNYSIYEEILGKCVMENKTPIDVANRAISAHFNAQIAMETFQLLFENVDNDNSLDMLLRHLGEYYQVSRCYVFERLEGGLNCYKNTYEWCAEGVSAQSNRLQNVAVSSFGEIMDEMNEDGIYYSNDVAHIDCNKTRDFLELQGIQSVLVTAVKKNERVEYFLGFDDVVTKRMWQPVEISTLAYASKLISQYLQYKKALINEQIALEEKMEVLESFNFHAYIIDKYDYTLSFYTEKTHKMFPHIQKGAVCYEAIRGKESPCKQCPLNVLLNKGATKVKMVMYNERLQTNVLVTASYLKSFEGVESIFISSVDISELVGKTAITQQEMDYSITVE
ncbi:MAG: GGDEF domain-containing protein [Eubacteriales bacterium]